ncbi:MAG TPA: thermonuclease family protein [Acidobacteriota bacterium]|nr:thermonuclease family protein [Acidobacteriota bacterium]HNC43551.1 thermonuclease family protein [Acidobacteriota bacterium]HNG94579.1 thermonuclease family protein [Acidobacteriota bacterium]
MGAFLRVIALCLIWTAVTSSAQDKRNTQPVPVPECGDPVQHSDFYLTPNSFAGAKITTLSDSLALVLTLKNKHHIEVTLAGVDLTSLDNSARLKIRKHLNTKVLGAQMEILLSGNIDFSKLDQLTRVEALVMTTSDGQDIGLKLIEQGLAAYQEPNRLGSYDRCVYRVMEARAKASHLGIWSQ